MKPRRIIALLVFAIAIAAAFILLRRYLTWEALIAREDQLRQLVETFPATSLLAALAVYVAASLVPGTSGKSLVFGWLFGFWAGLVIVNVGLTAAALISFFVIRYVFQAAAHARLGRLIRRIDGALRREGAFYLLTLRLIHAPYTMTNYAAGATTVRTRTFWWTTHLGLLPGNAVFVLAGAQIPSLRVLIEEGPWSLINVPLLAALSLTALLPVCIRTALRRWSSSDAARSNHPPTNDPRPANPPKQH